MGLENTWRTPEYKHWEAFLHLKYTTFQQQGCSGSADGLYDLENKIEETRFSFPLKRTLNSVSVFPQPASLCIVGYKYWSENAKTSH